MADTKLRLLPSGSATDLHYQKKRKCCDFVVCGTDSIKKAAHIVMEHINPDNNKLKIGGLLEDLHPAKESWGLVHKCTLPLAPDINGICYSHIQQDKAVITRSNRLALTCMLNFTFHDWL